MRAVEDAVIESMERGPDAEDVDKLPKSGDDMRHCARMAFRMPRAVISLDDPRYPS